MDPLSVLRDYTTRGELDKIRTVGDDFWFGDEYKFARGIETAYRSKQGSFYTLDCLVFFVQNAHLKHTEYMQQARKHNIHTVTFTDRKPLLDYLQGKLDTTDAIDLVAPAAAAAANTAENIEEYRPEEPSLGFFENGSAGGAGTGAASAKRIRVDSAGDAPEDDADGAGGGDELDASNGAGNLDVMELIRVRERPLKDRDTLLECPNRNFQSIVLSATKRDEESRHDRGMSTPANGHFRKDSNTVTAVRPVPRPPSQSSAPRVYVAPKGRPDGPPIIVVPSAFQTLLNIYNVKEFLVDGVYVPPDVKVKQMPHRPESLVIHRKIGKDNSGKDIVAPYEIRDKPSSMSSKDWERVAAIFVLGKDWQFKGFPYKSPVEIFNNYIGFYLRFEDDGLESVRTVKQWNVKIINISKHKRHQDKAAALEFWDKLDNFLRSQKKQSCRLVS